MQSLPEVDWRLQSEIGKGTEVKATFSCNHIDRQPLGDIAGVIVMLIAANARYRFYILPHDR